MNNVTNEAQVLSLEKMGVEFNRNYAGYYPKCDFTAIADGDGMIFLAGNDSEGRPHLFSTLGGGVWEKRNLTAKTAYGMVHEPKGRVVCILWYEKDRQIFLFTDTGQFIVLPDCPKCVKITELGIGIQEARIEGNTMYILFENGTEKSCFLDSVSQYRVARTMSDKLMEEGAYVVDLRRAEEYAVSHIRGSENISLDHLDSWLMKKKKADKILFICEVGTQADEAVRYARSQGFSYAYSMGGYEPLTHIE